MRLNLFGIVSLCLMSLILSCGDDEDEPSIDVVMSPTESLKVEAGIPDADNLSIADPVEEQLQNLQPDEEVKPREHEVVDPVEPDVQPIQDAIDGVLERMREGYEKEDIDLYLSAFWIDGFRYTSDMATPHDRFDDVIFDELKTEGESARRVFARFEDIGLQIFRPARIVNAAPERIEAVTHYRVQAFANDGHALEGGFLPWYAEGDARFTFEFREEEWRITKWLDDAFNVQEILEFNEGIKLEVAANPIDKLASTWGRIKTAF